MTAQDHTSAQTATQEAVSSDGAAASPHARGWWVVLMIGFYKFGKALLMVMICVTALRLVHRDVVAVASHWARRLHLDPENRILEQYLYPKLVLLTDSRLRLVGWGALAYTALYLIEGVGLTADKRWAQWLTAGTGFVLVPPETWAFVHKPTIEMAGVILFNLAIGIYLIWYVHRKQQRGRHASSGNVSTRQSHQGPP